MSVSKERIVEEILHARERIYQVNPPTPLDEITLDGIDAQIFLKREDLSAINAYKWRGAYNAIATLDKASRKKPIIAASAGNHAQGVALAAREQGLKARIYMPLTTPKMKQIAVKKHGGDNVEIVLVGDTYNEAGDEAIAYAKKKKAAYIHPYDNLYTLAGQATIADEMVMSGKGPFDIVFIPIGGGGMASGMSTWLRLHYPDIKIIGVEGIDQASMKASIEAGKLVNLPSVDTFCDGTAVKKPGKLCFEVCRKTLDDIITVTNDEVCAAIETAWATKRFIPEPSGAMGLAGLIKYAEGKPKTIKGKKLGTVICGANMDFSKLRVISANSAEGSYRQKFLRFEMNERSGSLLNLIEDSFSGVNIRAFQYGKVSHDKGWPVIAFQAKPEDWQDLQAKLKKAKVKFEDITSAPDTRYRVINYAPHLFSNPLFLHIDFPERKGALRDLLKVTAKMSNICYFNYYYTGETVGRALMGFEFGRKSDQKAFLSAIKKTSVGFEHIDKNMQERMLFAE